MRGKRILLVNEGALERAGICLFMYQWLHTLTSFSRENMITVYFRQDVKDTSLKQQFEETGIHIIAGNRTSDGTASKANRDGIKDDLRRIFRDHYDIVHINSSVIGFTSLVLSEALRAKAPIRISHSHGKFGETMFIKCLHDLLRIYVRNSATVYAGCSNQAGVYMFGEKGIHSAKWLKIPNAIETERFAFNEQHRNARRKEIDIEEDEILIGAVGYLEEVKNHAFLIDMMGVLKKKGVRAKLIILGSGNLMDELSLKIRSLCLEKDIILYGRSDDIPGWLSAMDCYVMPSLSEGLPISAVEAQASGLKCILSDRISGETDITPNVCHLPLLTDQWAEEIAQMETNGSHQRLLGLQQVKEAGFDSASLEEAIKAMYQLRLDG